MTDDRKRSEDDGAVERGRTDERGDAAEPDAPVAAEQNEGMSTILSADPLDGVQGNDGES